MMNKKTKLKAVFFDFGGTLMDSESDKIAHFNVMKELRKRYQISTSEEELVNEYHTQLFNIDMTLKDRSIKNHNHFNNLSFYSENAFRTLLNLHNIQFTEQDICWFNKIHLENHISYVRLLEGAKDIVLFVKAKGLHCGIISDIDNEYLVEQFKALGLSNIFHSITTSEEARTYKPNPLIFKTALNKANCLGKDAMMVGDSYHKDILGGRNMNMTTIWIDRYQYFSGEANLADYVIHQLNEIKTIVNNLL